MELLRECPFCGSNDLDEIIEPAGYIEICCGKCDSTSPIEQWNTRHSPWISVKDKEPSFNELILINYIHKDNSIFPNEVSIIRLSYGSVDDLLIKSGDKGFSPYVIIPTGEIIRKHRITHWMPLPKPPKET